MKISRVHSYILRAPLGSQTFYSSQALFPERTSCLVRIDTDEGLTGWGEGGQWGPPEPVAEMLDRVLAPRLLGRDPAQVGVLWEQLYAYIRDWGRQSTGMEALSAVDIALWDLRGKALGQPVYALLGVYWFEEPVAPEDRAGYRQVTEALDLAVAGGECEYTRYGFRDLLVERCVDIAQPDLTCAGGLSEGMKIAALAAAFGVQVMPHVWGSGIALAAALQFLAAQPPSPATANPLSGLNEPLLEFDRNPNPLRDELLAERITLGPDGTVAVPAGPGLGVTVLEEALDRYGG